MSPQRANLVLTADVPHRELNVLVVHSPAHTTKSNELAHAHARIPPPHHLPCVGMPRSFNQDGHAWKQPNGAPAYLLNIEANSGDGGDDLAQLQFVEDGSLPCGVETDHKNANFFLAKQAGKSLRDRDTHGDGWGLLAHTQIL